MANLAPVFAPSKSLGGARVKAAIRCGSVKVWYISSAVVRNSSVAVTVVVLTEELPVVEVVVLEGTGVGTRSF